MHQHAPGQLAPTGTARHLRQQLESAFGSAKVRQSQNRIGREHPHQRHSLKVVPFGDHLRAHQDVQLAPHEPPQNSLRLTSPGGGVAVQPRHPCGRESTPHHLFYLLRPLADVVEMLAPALLATVRNTARIPAVVAEQPAPPAVERQRNAAIGALHCGTALTAQQKVSVAAPVSQQQHLPAGGQRFFNSFHQGARKQFRLPGFLKLGPHVHQSHCRQRAISHPARHRQQLVAPRSSVITGFQRRCRRPQNSDRAFELRAHHRRVAPVVARRFTLLVASVLLFVHNHQTQILYRCKYG